MAEEIKIHYLVKLYNGARTPRLEDYGVVTKDGYEPFTTSTHDLVVIDC